MAPVDGLSDAVIREILTSVRTIAVVGASPNPSRPSNEVLGVLIERGYETFPVNPGHSGALIRGRPVCARLADVPAPIDMVDVFRNSAAAGGVVDEALRLDPRPKVIWMQLGVINEQAAVRARAVGVSVVMNRCPAIELRAFSVRAFLLRFDADQEPAFRSGIKDISRFGFSARPTSGQGDHKQTLELHGDAFNALNSAQFTNPNSNTHRRQLRPD